jgi:hypothetical protein
MSFQAASPVTTAVAEVAEVAGVTEVTEVAGVTEAAAGIGVTETEAVETGSVRGEAIEVRGLRPGTRKPRGAKSRRSTTR